MSWWLAHMEAWNGRAIFGPVPDLVIESDASRAGWGARCGNFSTGGEWSLDEQALHINCLELLAGSFAVRCWTRDRVQSCVLLKMDNISAVRYVNHVGGPRSLALADLAKAFWEYCLNHHISVTAEYLPGQANQVADWHSRYLRDSSLWKLDETVFQWLAHLWGPFTVDLFASRLDHQLPRFFS